MLGEPRSGRPEAPVYPNALLYPTCLAICANLDRPMPNKSPNVIFATADASAATSQEALPDMAL